MSLNDAVVAAEAAVKAFEQWFTSETDRVIHENLADPDLALTDASFKAGYARGYREATAAFVLYQTKSWKKP